MTIDDELFDIDKAMNLELRRGDARRLKRAVEAEVIDDGTAVRLLHFWYPES